MSPWERMLARLYAGGLAETVSYTPKGGTAQVLRVLIGRRDTAGEIGGRSIEQDTLELEARIADLPAAGAGDGFTWGGYAWVISNPPVRDELGLQWRIRAYRGEAL